MSRVIIRDLEKFWILTEITILPIFRNSDFPGFHIFPQTCHFLSFMYFVLKYGQIRVLYCRIMFKEGNWLLIFWLMMGLAIGSSKELVYMLMHIIGAGFERLKLLNMA